MEILSLVIRHEDHIISREWVNCFLSSLFHILEITQDFLLVLGSTKSDHPFLLEMLVCGKLSILLVWHTACNISRERLDGFLSSFVHHLEVEVTILSILRLAKLDNSFILGRLFCGTIINFMIRHKEHAVFWNG